MPPHIAPPLWRICRANLAFFTLVGAPAAQQDDPWSWDRLLGARGIALELDVIAESSRPFSGGIDQDHTERALIRAGLGLDLERLVGMDGWSGYVEGYSQAGPNASADVGDVQGYSNLDIDNVTQLSELWIEHEREGLRVKVGKVDANTEFAGVAAGGGFLNSSAGYSPTIFVFPSYPDPAVSLNGFLTTEDGWRAGLGVYNAADGGAVSGRRGMTADFDSAFLIAQVERTFGDARVAFGGWHHTGDLARFDGGTEPGTEGAFAVVEHTLSHRLGLTGFAQWGDADGSVSAVEGHLAVGLVCDALPVVLAPDVERGTTGLYVSSAELSDDPAAGLGGREVAFELYQELPLTQGITLRPDLQYIADPSGSKSLEDTWVATLRVEISL